MSQYIRAHYIDAMEWRHDGARTKYSGAERRAAAATGEQALAALSMRSRQYFAKIECAPEISSVEVLHLLSM